MIQIYFRKRVVRENQCGGTGGSLHTAEVQANSPAQENVVYIYYVCQIYQQYQYQYQIYVPAISISNIPAISISNIPAISISNIPAISILEKQ